MKDGGTGIYSPTSPCPATIFGVRALVPPLFYYQNDRETANLKTGELDIFPGQTVPIAGQPCPILGSGTGEPLTVGIAPLNFFGPYAGVAIDQLICLQGNVDCFPDPLASRAVVTHCNKNNAEFILAEGKEASKSSIPGFGSNSIICEGPLGENSFKYDTVYYANGPAVVGDYCQDWFFDNGNWGTDYCLIQVEDTTPLGDGIDQTGYLVTCMRTTALVVDALKGIYTRTFESHDYLLVRDLDGTPENWVAAKQKHWNIPPAPGTLPLQGWHDLSGKNGFPCDPGTAPPDKKAKTNDFGQILPTPLSPKKGD